LLEKLRRKKKEPEKEWFPERKSEKKIKKQKIKSKKTRKPKKRTVEIEYLDDEIEEKIKIQLPFLRTINRIIAGVMFLINMISGVMSLTFNGGLLFASSFFFTAYILAGYLWKSRRKKEWV